MRGMIVFFRDVYSTSPANDGIILRHSSYRKYQTLSHQHYASITISTRWVFYTKNLLLLIFIPALKWHWS